MPRLLNVALLVCLTAVLGIGMPGRATAASVSLRDAMSAAEFKAAGLDKLSAAELALLEAWMRTHAGADAESAVPEAAGSTAEVVEAPMQPPPPPASAQAPVAAPATPAVAAGAPDRAASPDITVSSSHPASAPVPRAAPVATVSDAAASEQAEAVEDVPWSERWRLKHRKDDQADADVEASVVGEFKGWRGDTYFPLSNGQVWQQRGDDKYFYRGTSAEVRIFRNRLGFYVLEVRESGQRVGVKRLQ
ncbi:MAG: hypothetical protein R3E86_21915 [Pseudomonadales bacterium]